MSAKFTAGYALFLIVLGAAIALASPDPVSTTLGILTIVFGIAMIATVAVIEARRESW